MEHNYESRKNHDNVSDKLNKFHLFFLFVLMLLSGNNYSQQSYTFTNASATGSVGPIQSQITSAYFSTNLSGFVTATAGIQYWKVPTSGNYGVRSIGASGGGISAGLGADITGSFYLNAGDTIVILVGQMGMDALDGSTTGGGGSFALLRNATSTIITSNGRPVTPLVIAGGGGGNPGTASSACNGTVVTSGNNGNGADGSGIGGVNGNGGGISVPSGNNRGGGGGGLLTDGDHSGTCGTGGLESGRSFLNGGTGGLSTSCSTGYPGGFGGGGGSISSGWRSSGGGGGYSGGGGGQTNLVATTHYGGGGGSYNGGTSQLNTIATATGNGKVIISELCNIKIFAAGGTNSVSPAICSGQSLTLTTNAVSNYTWSTTNTTNTLIVVSPTSSQTYSIIGTSSLACQAVASISVTVNSIAPVLTITNTPNSICLGKTATLTAGGAVTYTWAGGPGGIINGQTFTPTATSNYTVTGQNGCGTTTSVTTITIAPLAMTVAASPSLSCSGNPVTLSVTSAVTGYTWSPGPITGSNVIVVPTANTVYTVTASDGTCSGVASVTVNTKPNPTLTIIPSNTTVCQGAVVTMTASGAATYTWVSPSSNAPNISDNPTSVTLYQVSGTNSVNCVSSTSQLIFTQGSPTVIVSADKIFVCAGAAVTLTASGATIYNWTNGPATAGNIVNPTSNSTYTVTGTTSPCSGTAAITINVLTPSVSASASTPSICSGESSALHASGATSYTWVGQTSFSPGNATVNPTITTIYTVNANTTSGTLTCPSSTNITVTVFDNPTVSIISTKSVVCKSDPSIVLTGGGAVTYTWSTATVSTNINVHPQSTTTYSITGVDANGCMNTASKVIVVNACNGIVELTNEEKTISVYPNPSNGEFVVSADSEISLKLINELGQEIRTIKLSEQNDYKVSVTNLANGVYFIVGQNGTDKVNQKIIIAR